MESQKGEREDDDLKDLTHSAAKLDVATDDILIDGEEGEEDEMSQEEKTQSNVKDAERMKQNRKNETQEQTAERLQTQKRNRYFF